MKLVNRQYIPGYGNLRVIDNRGEIATIVTMGQGLSVYDSIGKFLFRYMGEYVLIPYNFLWDRG